MQLVLFIALHRYHESFLDGIAAVLSFFVDGQETNLQGFRFRGITFHDAFAGFFCRLAPANSPGA